MTFTKAADVFAFGSCAYELWTRTAVEENEQWANTTDEIDAMTNPEREPHAPLPPLGADASDELQQYVERVVKRCWQREPAQRPTFLELVDTFDELEALVKE